MPGRDQRDMTHRRRRWDPCRHHAPQETVQVAVGAQAIGKNVVGDQAPEVAKFAGHEHGQKGVQVAGD
jgi:hypothetical protein